MPELSDRSRKHILNEASPVALIVSQLDGDYYTISEAAEITGYSVSTLRRWYRRGPEQGGTKGPSKEVRQGDLKIYLYTEEDIEEIKARPNRNKVQNRGEES